MRIRVIFLLPLLVLALLATYKLVAAARFNKTDNYQMSDEQWRTFTQAREAEISAELAQQKAFLNYQQAVANIRLENKWPNDIVFDNQTMKWQKQTPQAAPAPKPAEPVKK